MGGVHQESVSERESARNGRTYKAAVWSVRRIESPEERKARESGVAKADKVKAQAIANIWSEASPLTEDTKGTRAVLAYLRWGRGITLSAKRLAHDDSIRAVDAMRTLEGDKSYPAMVAAVRNPQGKIVTLHVTYLTEEGAKAPVATQKRLMALPSTRTIRHAAIRLAEPVACWP